THNIEDSNSLSSDYITGLSSDQNGRMWITTRNGLNIYQSSTDEFQRYHFDLTVRNEFRPFDFNDVLVDRLGTVWLASVENGLIQLIPHFQTFRLYNSANQPQLSSNQMTSVYLDRFSRLWVGTNYGLNLVDRNRTHVEHFFEQPFSNRSISNDYIIDIEGDGMGRVWLATRNGLNYYDEKQSRFRQFKANDPFFTKIEDIELFDEKQIWVAGELGVAIINTIDLTKNAIETLKNIHASQLLFDTKQRLWIGQESQLLVYHVKSDSTAVYHHSPERNSISNDHILSLHEDGFGRIWIGTRAGLNRYREDSNDFEFIEEVVQLADDQIYWIESEKNGNLWVSTNKGLTRIVYSADQVQIKNFDSDDGLQNFAFNSSGFRTQTGELFFGGNNGLNSFYPGQIQDRPYQVPNIIESIVTNNRTIYLDINKVSDQVITLDYEDQVITFNFTSLDYINPDKNQYQYILENVDNEWIQAGKTHSVSYSNLLSGTYRFRFKGSNSSFNWNQTGASVTIVIKPPYWNSWWFSSLIALALFLVLFTFLYNRFKRLQEIREIRGRIARDLHDDIGASLTEVTLMSELAQQLNDKGQLNTVLAKIEDVTRGLVSSLGDLVWSIDTKNESLDSLLLRMKDFASDLLSRRDIGIEYQILGIKSNQKIDHHLKQTVYLIFKEAINNVVKHSTAKNVSVELRDDGKQFNLIIEDDGDGFDLNSEQTGNGLNNMKIRAKRVGGSVEFSIRKGLRIHLKTSALTK
ncbi:MAG: hypothetical protein KDD94_12255, partial [Calditrichaeota bacterium]|nr:hypothetical protein [Calditrichota bacterium]